MAKKVFVDLSHPFGADIPLWPYFSKPVIDTMHGQAKSGVLSQKAVNDFEHDRIRHQPAGRDVLLNLQSDGRLPPDMVAEHLAGGAVDRQVVALAQDVLAALDPQRASAIVDAQRVAAGDARLAHPAGDDCCV